MKMYKKNQISGRHLKIQIGTQLLYYSNWKGNMAISFLMLEMSKNSVNIILIY